MRNSKGPHTNPYGAPCLTKLEVGKESVLNLNI